MCGFCLSGDFSAAGDGDDVVEGECVWVCWWQIHVYWLSAYPAGGFFWVADEFVSFVGDFALPARFVAWFCEAVHYPGP